MKTAFLPFAMIAGLLIGLTNCGEKAEEKKAEPAKDTTSTVQDTIPAYTYTYKVEEIDVQPRWILAVSDSTDMSSLQPFFAKNFPLLGKFLGSKKITTEAPVAFFHDFSFDKKFYTTAAMYIGDSTLKVKSPMTVQKAYSGKALKVVYMGNYNQMTKAYEDIQAYMTEKGLAPNGANWEQYITDPMAEKDTSKWQTDIYFPVIQGK